MSGKKIIAILSVLILAGAAYGLYLFNKPAPKVENEKALAISASDLFDAYVKSPSIADSKYLNKALEVNGIVTDFKQNQEGGSIVYFQTNDPIYGVTCSFLHEPGALEKGSTITVKGFCTGYLGDSLETSDVKMDRGILVKK